jgi:hypothetical protein
MKVLNRLKNQVAERKRLWVIAGIVAAAVIVAGSLTIGHFRASGTPVASVQKPSTCAQTYKLAALRPSQITAANRMCLVQTLAFGGELTGAVGQAYPVGANDVGPTSICSVPKRWDAFPQALLAMTIGSKAYRLRIAIPGRSEHQSVTVNTLANVVELASITDPTSDWNQALGTLTVDPDGTTGTIDASLSRDVAGAQPVHVRGQWACGAPLPIPTFDPTIPCSSFYTLNQLQPGDVSRMNTSGCHPQDLTFSGDISTHVDHALTDPAYQSGGTYIGDNFCSQAYGTYAAMMKFSIGDESFQLNLNAFGDGSVTPGQYPAVSDTGVPHVNLFLGTADPGNHGTFVIDNRIQWGATTGTFTIAQDMKSGTIDAELTGPLDQPFSSVHIAGGWRCAA